MGDDEENEKGTTDQEKVDLITIVSSEEKEIPEKAPPFDDVLYDFIPPDQKKHAASKHDHVSKHGVE